MKHGVHLKIFFKSTFTLISILLIFSIILLSLNQNIVCFASVKTFPGVNKNYLPKIKSKSVILVEKTSGTIIYGKNINQKNYPASTQKIMTGMLGLENIKLNEKIVGDHDTEFAYGSKIFFLDGEVAPFSSIIHALLIPSGNDAAIAIAKKVSGNVKNFVALMNKKAKSLGANNTNFKNPSGLDEKDNYTTAYDLSLIAREALKNKVFSDIVKKQNYEMPKTNKQVKRYFVTTNRLLFDNLNTVKIGGVKRIIKYDDATGVKTGHDSAYSLVASAKRGTTSYLAVILGGSEFGVYEDALNLFEYGFNNFTGETVLEKNEFAGTVKIKNGEVGNVDALLSYDFFNIYPNKNVSFDDLKEVIVPVNDLTAPIKKGTYVGDIKIFYKGHEITSQKLISSRSVKVSFFHKYRLFIIFILFFVLALLLILAINIIRWKNIRKRKYNSYTNKERLNY